MINMMYKGDIPMQLTGQYNENMLRGLVRAVNVQVMPTKPVPKLPAEIANTPSKSWTTVSLRFATLLQHPALELASQNV